VWYDAKNPNVDWGNDGEVNVKNLKTTGLELVMIVIAILFSLPLVLTSPLVGLDPLVFGPVIAVVCAAATLVAGRVLLAATERSVQMME
jgi:ABC-type Co2+ transport system permease subunit